MTTGLAHALRQVGHNVEIVTMPFKFFPESHIDKMMDIWCESDFGNFSGYPIDKVIALQFPAYYVNHKDKIVWLMHQHRAVYELYHEQSAPSVLNKLKDKIWKIDSDKLSSVKKVFTMSKTVSKRLQKNNGIDSIPLYHPPFGEKLFYNEKSYDYIFFPSRLEELKRQELLIQAMKLTRTPVKAIIAGAGGMHQRYQDLIDKLKIADKVKLIGPISEQEKYTYYARSLAVFFSPFDEDYGYITLESMLSSKPVMTCNDSGGPLEFVLDGETGYITEPLPEAIAEAIDKLYMNKRRSIEMGNAGLQHYLNMNITWENVVGRLLS